MLGALFRRSGASLLAARPATIRGLADPTPQSLVSRRLQCSKPETDKPKNEGSRSAEYGKSFEIPGLKPTNFDKKFLIWGGRFKKESDIPEFVSNEMMTAVKGKLRIKFAMLMMLMTIVGCIVMVISGKRATKQHQSLSKINLDKKRLLKEEAEK